MIIEYTIAIVCQSDELTDEDVSSILSKLIDMFHGCVFLIDQIIDYVEDKQVRLEDNYSIQIEGSPLAL